MGFKHIPFGSPEKFNVVLEIPTGSRNKYEYDEKLDAIKLDFVFSEKFKYIFNYGHIPETRCGDGDHSDCIILAPYPIDVGTIVECRPIGIIELLDRGEEDNKIIAVPTAHETSKYKSLSDISEKEIQEFRDFFQAIAKEKNKIIEIKNFLDKNAAIEELKKCREKYLSQQK